MAKKQKCPEFENHERWLVAWADMLTLLFALFVVLYSIANVEVEKLEKVKQSIQAAFGSSSDPSQQEGYPEGNSRVEGVFDKVSGNTSRESVFQKDRKESLAIINHDFKTIEADLSSQLVGQVSFPESDSKGTDGRVVFVNRDADGIRVTLLARHFFEPSSSTLSSKAYPTLDGIVKAIQPLGRVIRVEGHTDNRPFQFRDMTNWELSSLRASAVVRYFIDKHKYPQNMIYPAGFAATRPVAPNDTPQNRSLNRRVDIKILYENPAPLVDPHGQAPPSEPVPEATGSESQGGDATEEP